MILLFIELTNGWEGKVFHIRKMKGILGKYFHTKMYRKYSKIDNL
jgi:hypothetical protein